MFLVLNLGIYEIIWPLTLKWILRQFLVFYQLNDFFNIPILDFSLLLPIWLSPLQLAKVVAFNLFASFVSVLYIDSWLYFSFALSKVIALFRSILKPVLILHSLFFSIPFLGVKRKRVSGYQLSHKTWSFWNSRENKKSYFVNPRSHFNWAVLTFQTVFVVGSASFYYWNLQLKKIQNKRLIF